MPGDKMCRRREGHELVTARVNRSAVRLAVVLAALLLDAGLSLAAAQTKLDASYSATLLGLPIGHISWTVELHNNRFTTEATGGISGLLRLFSDGHGDVSSQGNLAAGAPVASNFALKLIAGKWSDEVRILFRGNKAQEYVTAAPAPGANQVPITEANRTGVLDPMTAMLVHIPGAGKTDGAGSLRPDHTDLRRPHPLQSAALIQARRHRQR